jgi:DNA-binding SARP family transcriptional activator
VLLLHATEFVSHDRLIDALWGESPTAGRRTQPAGLRLDLRKALAEHGRRDLLVTGPGGYMVDIEPEQLDLDRFQALVGEARSLLAGGGSTRAAETLRQALSLWRGEPLADLQFEPFAQDAIERLDELRTAALTGPP